MKKITRYSSILIMISFIAIGCSEPSDTKEVKKIPIVWVNPTNAICKANGGEIFINECRAKWEDAPKICKAFGARLPTFDELKSAMTGCGGILNEVNRNENNQTYQKCREELGFSNSWYWSSTEVNSLKGACLEFEMGYDAPSLKSKSIDVICVDENSSQIK